METRKVTKTAKMGLMLPNLHTMQMVITFVPWTVGNQVGGE